MIRDRKELREFLNCDMRNYRILENPQSFREKILGRLVISPIADQTKIWEYIKVLRYCEYWSRSMSSNPLRFLLNGGGIYLYYLHRLRKLARITGFQIPPNTTGKGLTIWHWGFIIINPETRIGDFCTLHPGIVIGHKEPGLGAPRIGNNVIVGSGARIIGDIEIGDDVNIAPNAVVVHDIPAHSIVAGIPARVIKCRKGINEPWVKNINNV